MQSRRVLRITSCVAIKVEEERKLHGGSVARPSAVPRAESCMAARRINVNGVISVRNRTRDDFAYLCQDGRSPVSAAWRRGSVNNMALVRDGVAHRSVCVGVFVRGIGVGRIPDTAIKSVEATHLITGQAVPVLPPENGGSLSSEH